MKTELLALLFGGEKPKIFLGVLGKATNGSPELVNRSQGYGNVCACPVAELKSPQLRTL